MLASFIIHLPNIFSLNHATQSKIKDFSLITSRGDKRCTLSKMVALCPSMPYGKQMWKRNINLNQQAHHIFEFKP